MRPVQTFGTTILDADSDLGVDISAIPTTHAGVDVGIQLQVSLPAMSPTPVSDAPSLERAVQRFLDATAEMYGYGTWGNRFHPLQAEYFNRPDPGFGRPPRADDIQAFARYIVREPVIPLSQSPIQGHALAKLVQGGGALTTSAVGVAVDRPMLIVWTGVAIIVIQTAQAVGSVISGAGEGLGKGLRVGLHQSVARKFGVVETDIPREDDPRNP
jgi:hypothetical protein